LAGYDPLAMAPTATTTSAARAPRRARPRAAEFRAALDEALADADADDRIGPLIGATKLRLRFEFPDAGLVLNVAAADGDSNLSWSFAEDPGWSPRLELEMDSPVANRYLQGRESLAIAIARGQVRVRGESRVALLYLPAAGLLCEPYRRVVEAGYPALATR
jgi:hypothetical protein